MQAWLTHHVLIFENPERRKNPACRPGSHSGTMTDDQKLDAVSRQAETESVNFSTDDGHHAIELKTLDPTNRRSKDRVI